MTVNRGGRPRYVAVIDESKDLAQPYYDTFYEICNTFKYRDIMALSRALGIHASTVEKWKYRKSMPAFATYLYVIEWVRLGKPMKTELPGRKSSSFSML
jgi:hypothetical protein